MLFYLLPNYNRLYYIYTERINIMRIDKPLHFSKQLLKKYVREGDEVIDATVGNGNDTVTLASLVGRTGKVFGFDIQEQAINNTHQKLQVTGLYPQVQLFHTGHQHINDCVPLQTSIQAAVFNLGYLPQADKEIVTQPQTTLQAIQQSLKRLKVTGCISIMIYHGHPGGQEEKEAIIDFVQTLPQESYHVLRYEIINQRNAPPFLIFIERIQ